MIKKNKSKLSRLFPNVPVILAEAVLVIAILLFILEITNTTHLFHKQKIPPLIKPSSSNSNSSSGQSLSTPSSSSSPANSTKNSSSGSTTPPAGTSLLPPYGNFVSNHHPSDSLSNEVSVCNTTPGADCYIRLSNGSASTQLPSQTVGSDGSTSWNWNYNNDAHLTTGEWQVTAIASLNGQTKSTDDQLKLVIP